MKKYKIKFKSLKLNHKITIIFLGIIVLPLFILSLLLFENIRVSQIKENMKNVELNFTQNYGEIQKKVEMCGMSTQIVLNNHNFWKYVSLYSSGNDIDTLELIQFYKNEIAGIEKMVTGNPYLYQIRVYVDSDTIPEMMPVLYRYERLKRLSWAKEGNYKSGTWQFDYVDDIFPAFRLNTNRHIVSLVTDMKLREKEINTVIEVAMRMELLFPDLYSSTEKEWSCFVDEENNIYYNTDYDSKWLGSVSNMIDITQEGYATNYIEQMNLNGEPVIVCFKPIKELNGHFIKIVSLKEDLANVNTLQNIFWLCFLIIVLLMLFLLNKIMTLVLKQFYTIMNTIRKIQKGDLEIRIPDHSSNDEFGELGQQINKMLNRITQLMEGNIKKEILFKDSEIRALQNQINAHFIYNVLESIKMMAEVDEKYDMADAVTALGKLLRYSMKWVSNNVTVEEEIDYIKNYLALINLRFDYEIYLSLNISKEIYQQRIPKMSLQPIIENAIYHGIEGIAEDTSIYMKGNVYDDYCIIEITDSGRGMTEEEVIQLQKKIDGMIETTGSSGNGIGLKNVQDRIKITFGETYGLSIVSKEGCFTKVIVKIPLSST